MDDTRKACIEQLEWKDVRAEFTQVNPELAAIIDEISPDSKYPLFKARYPFGSEILRDGYLQVPDNEGGLISFLSNKVSNHLKECLGYNLGSNPVTVPLVGCAELFLKKVGEHSALLPYGLIPAGKIFGLWRILGSSLSNHPPFIWGMTSGARSLTMLPKISKTLSHKKLQRALNISCDIPKNLTDHWLIFKEIDKNFESETPWVTELLFFSHSWFSSIKDTKWTMFRNYLLQSAWDASESWRNQFFWDVVFSFIMERKNIKPEPSYINIIKHLLTIGIGAAPGLAPAIDNSAGPIEKFCKAYHDIYDIQYAPIIMQPLSFSMSSPSRPVYYSLEFPTNAIFSKKSKNFSNKITELDMLYHLLKKIKTEIVEGCFNLENTPFYNVAKDIDYDFFHKDVSRYKELKSSDEIPNEDPNFSHVFDNQAHKPFPENCPFVCGCIRLSSNLILKKS